MVGFIIRVGFIAMIVSTGVGFSGAFAWKTCFPGKVFFK